MLVEWDVRENQRRVFGPWCPFTHPQLGDVEIGGIDPVCGLLNPPEKEIAPICQGLASFAIALASLAPRLQTRISTARVDEDLTKINLFATNSGYLPTYVSAASQTQSWN